MSYDYELVGSLPEPGEAMARISGLFGEPVDLDTDPQVPRIFSDGLLVVSHVVDEEDRKMSRRHLGYDTNLALTLADYSRGDVEMHLRIMGRLLAVATTLAGISGFRGALFVDYGSDDTYLADITAGRVVLNSTFWDDWEAGAEVLGAVPEPFAREELRMRA